MKCPRHITGIMNIHEMKVHEPAVPGLFGGCMIAFKVWLYHTYTSPEEVTERVEWPLDGTLVPSFGGVGNGERVLGVWISERMQKHVQKRPHLAGEIRI